MAGIPDSVIDDIRQRADIVDVISSYITLKPAGANYRALCPFHTEKTPSFSVNQAKQIFHCFGCGEGGNVFSFLMKHENLTFPESVKTLADRYGVTIPEKNSGHTQKHDALYKAMEAAANFYHKLLVNQESGSVVSRYLEKREITPELVETFKLGWAPEGWDILARHMIDEKKFAPDVIEKAGLVKPGKHGLIDRFRGRLLFPIKNRSGSIVAFGGRIIGSDEKSAKYLNSPETPIYHKSSILFGYTEATSPARSENRLILTEGYMDVLALHKAGLKNCAAVCGVALTEQHAELVRRICGRATLMFDSDVAGVAATKRAGPALVAKGLSAFVTLFAEAKDPDEFVKLNGKERLLALIEEAPSYHRFMIDDTLSRRDLARVEDKIAAVKEVMSHLAIIKDDIERSQYVTYLSEKTGTDASLIEKQAEKRAKKEEKPPLSVNPAFRRKAKKAQSGVERAEKVLLGALLAHPGYLTGIASELKEYDFPSDSSRNMFALIKEGAAAGIEGIAAIIGMAEEEGLRKDMTSLSMESGLFEEREVEKAIKDCVAKLKFDPKKEKIVRDEVVSAAKEADAKKFAEAQKNYLESRKKKYMISD